MGYSYLGNAYHSLGKLEEAIEYHNQHLSIAKEVGDRVGEGTAYGLLGGVYLRLGKFQEAKECFFSSVEVFDVVRSSLKSQDAWKISFRHLYRNVYTGLWKTLLKLDLTDEALYAAERGRAQALVDSLKIQYGLTAHPSASVESKEAISYISNKISTKTIFVGLSNNVITFWVIDKENKFELREIKLVGRSAHEDYVSVLLESTLMKVGAGVRVRCENRSLDEPIDDSSSERGDDQEPAQPLQCTIESLQPLHDVIIGPIADLCQGDELIIVPDGPLCLAPFSALSESLRIRTVPSLSSLKLILASPEDYHRKSGALIVGDPCLNNLPMNGVNPSSRN